MQGWDKDQCWTLAGITEVVRSRFGVEQTLAGMDLLLHRIGWSVQVPARRAAGRDEARIAAWREETWPVIKAISSDGWSHRREIAWVPASPGWGFAAARWPGVLAAGGRADGRV